MKSYKELSEEEKIKALDYFAIEVLEGIMKRNVRFDDAFNKNDLQARIDAAVARAEKEKMPFFIQSYIMDTCREYLRDMAIGDAETAVYLSLGERAVYLDCQR